MKISIITATYNSVATVRDTFESVLNQIYPDIEYIVIDGDSKDATVDLIEEYEVKFKGHLKWVSEQDKGIYDAMNKGIVMATGDVIGILNSDDFFTSNDVLEKIAQEFEKEINIDAVYGDIHFVDPNNLQKCKRYYSSAIFRPYLFRFGFMPAHPSFYVKRDCYEKYGLYRTDYKISADFELLLRFIYVNHISIRYLPLDMVTMRMGGASTSGLKSHIQIMKEHLKACRENNFSTNFFLLILRYMYKLTEFFQK